MTQRMTRVLTLVSSGLTIAVWCTGCTNSESNVPTNAQLAHVQTQKAPLRGAVAAPEYNNAPTGVKTGDYTGGLAKKLQANAH